MPDREKVIDELIMLKRFIPSTMWEPISDAIELLKEQQQQIWELQDQVEYFTDKQKEQEVVDPQDAEMLIVHNGGAEEYVKDIESIVLLAHKDYDIVYCGTFGRSVKENE